MQRKTKDELLGFSGVAKATKSEPLKDKVYSGNKVLGRIYHERNILSAVEWLKMNMRNKENKHFTWRVENMIDEAFEDVMNQLKQLIKEVERLNKNKDNKRWRIAIASKLQGIKQTVEVTDDLMKYNNYECLSTEEKAEWFKLKELLGVK